MQPKTSRHLVVASAPRYCAVCAGDLAMRLVRIDRARGAVRVRCPHCIDRIPVLHLPLRDEHPRGAA